LQQKERRRDPAASKANWVHHDAKKNGSISKLLADLGKLKEPVCLSQLHM
jgi:hypothetical protein